MAFPIAALTGPYTWAFVALFFFRYFRLAVHAFTSTIYRPTPLPEKPTLTPRDCTVILPTVEPENAFFKLCLESVCANSPAALLIVTVGKRNLKAAKKVSEPFQASHPEVRIRVTKSPIANKRFQVCYAFPDVNTKITVLLDDHVSWPSKNFLPAILAPFESDKVGVVGARNTARHFTTSFGWYGFWNMVGSLYLERYNWENRATSMTDGGVYVIAGRTSALRTSIFKDTAFQHAFKNERFLFGLLGPLNADDDNFITRWAIIHDWEVKHQDSDDARIETTIGVYPKFISQCVRWARTTWRSNSTTLFTNRVVWRKHPWCVCAVCIPSFVNFALFYDSLLFFALGSCSFATPMAFGALVVWIIACKLVKVWPYFQRHPGDMVYLPGYILFTYFHSLIKLWAGLTFWETSWGSRNLALFHGKDNSGDENHETKQKDEVSDPPNDRDTNDRPGLGSEGSSKSIHLETRSTFSKMRSDNNAGIEEMETSTNITGFDIDQEFAPNGIIASKATIRQQWSYVKEGQVMTPEFDNAVTYMTKAEKDVRVEGCTRRRVEKL